jgi:DNA (cytosine-5)-methyltransferase 1
LDLGLEKAGIETVAYVEREPSCLATIRANKPKAVCFEDIRFVTGAEIVKRFGYIDLVVGGPPCQPFSTAGRMDAMNDPRGQMLLEYMRVVKEMGPKFFVMENVVGVTNAKVDGDQPVLDWMFKRLRGVGYKISHWKLNAYDYGVPQKRERIIVIGSQNGHVEKPKCHRPLVRTIRKVIEDLESEPGECAKFSDPFARIMRKVPEGGNWRDLDTRTQRRAMGGAYDSEGGRTAFYRRIHRDRPSPTLTTSPTQRATTLCHPTQTRPLSVREYGKFQGFPDSWTLVGSTAQKYRMLGNAVPLVLGEAIGRSLCRE